MKLSLITSFVALVGVGSLVGGCSSFSFQTATPSQSIQGMNVALDMPVCSSNSSLIVWQGEYHLSNEHQCFRRLRYLGE